HALGGLPVGLGDRQRAAAGVGSAARRIEPVVSGSLAWAAAVWAAVAWLCVDWVAEAWGGAEPCAVACAPPCWA
ncbi:hypothetical protein, partial [Klebsiella michiganensis]|uniref:hypothetical protein n=1 Tax=Klebsiella michiganensis TaxID=1134687 RepID=UPI0019546677